MTRTSSKAGIPIENVNEIELAQDDWRDVGLTQAHDESPRSDMDFYLDNFLHAIKRYYKQ